LIASVGERITHRLTAVRSPTTTGKIERFHKSLVVGLVAMVGEAIDGGHGRPSMAVRVSRTQRDGPAIRRSSSRKQLRRPTTATCGIARSCRSSSASAPR